VGTNTHRFNSISISLWFLLLVLCPLGIPSGRAADPAPPATSANYDYAEPKLLTGTLYAIGSNRKTVLFTFRRTATRFGSTVHVERQFLNTNGSVAAVEKVLYESNQLVSFAMQEFQANVSGSVQIEPDHGNPARPKIFISFDHGLRPSKGRARTLQPNTVLDDTLYPFLMAHWDDLMRGNAVKFRFVSLEWERTFEFELRKTADSEENGTPVARITMKPTSRFVAALVNPLIFIAQKNNPHRILSYTGRTTPRIRKGNSWKYLDAETVFDYPQK
jgi:hypothetical protein